MSISIKLVFGVLALICGFLKFFNINVGGTNNGKAWSLDLSMGFFVFVFLFFAWPL